MTWQGDDNDDKDGGDGNGGGDDGWSDGDDKNGNDNDLYDVDDNGLNLCLSLIYVPSAEERLQIILITC